ncbi:MAG: hypothetical protein Q9190_007396, partial [Brigantiaea leucoxantha]
EDAERRASPRPMRNLVMRVQRGGLATGGAVTGDENKKEDELNDLALTTWILPGI